VCEYMVYGCGGGREPRTEKNDIVTIILYITRGGGKNIIYKTKLNQQRRCANHIGVQTVYITVIVERVDVCAYMVDFFLVFLKHSSINYYYFFFFGSFDASRWYDEWVSWFHIVSDLNGGKKYTSIHYTYIVY